MANQVFTSCNKHIMWTRFYRGRKMFQFFLIILVLTVRLFNTKQNMRYCRVNDITAYVTILVDIILTSSVTSCTMHSLYITKREIQKRSPENASKAVT